MNMLVRVISFYGYVFSVVFHHSVELYVSAALAKCDKANVSGAGLWNTLKLWIRKRMLSVVCVTGGKKMRIYTSFPHELCKRMNSV